MLENQLKTVLDDSETPMYDRAPRAAQRATDMMGVPLELVRAKILGAWPVLARPYKAREDVYRSEEPADQAEATMVDGQNLRVSESRQHTQEAGIGNVRKDLDSGPLNGNDPGRGCRVTGIGDKARVVVWAYQTEDEDTEDVEQEDTDPDAANGLRDVLGRIAGFGGGHSENLSSQECVGGTDQDRPETSEPARSTWDVMVLGESARVMLD